MAENHIYDVIVVGGGAAGFFSAVCIAENRPDLKILLLEKSQNLLSKVRVSGGGRCNVTNGRMLPGELTDFYPRGQKKLHKVFEQFGTREMMAWLKDKGVNTKTEADLRVFPVSNSSQTVVDCLYGQAVKTGIAVRRGENVVAISQLDQNWSVTTSGNLYLSPSIVWATGSSEASWNVLDQVGLKRSKPVPSLFTFNIRDERLANLAGMAFTDVAVKIAGSKLLETGPLLITHWGLSGPSILKLSAWGARELASLQYKFQLIVDFTGGMGYEKTYSSIHVASQKFMHKKVKNMDQDWVPNRYWLRLTDLIGITEKAMGELSKKEMQKLAEELSQAHFEVNGKSTFKEEFVTCGGIELSEINLNNFECRRFPGLFLAGEVLDIDALTGGFNFQACWSAGWAVGQHFKQKEKNAEIH